MSQHALVVVDHHTARIYHLDGHDAGSLAVRQAAMSETDNRHQTDGKHTSHDKLYEAVASSLHNAKEILLLGSGTAKDELKHHLEKHHATIARHVVGVETIDHPTEPQLLAMAKKKFKTIDAWLGDQR